MPICIHCGKVLKTQQSLEYHYIRKLSCKDLKCKLCDIQFFTKFTLTIHNEKYHNFISKNENEEYVLTTNPLHPN